MYIRLVKIFVVLLFLFWGHTWRPISDYTTTPGTWGPSGVPGIKHGLAACKAAVSFQPLKILSVFLKAQDAIMQWKDYVVKHSIYSGIILIKRISNKKKLKCGKGYSIHFSPSFPRFAYTPIIPGFTTYNLILTKLLKNRKTDNEPNNKISNENLNKLKMCILNSSHYNRTQ